MSASLTLLRTSCPQVILKVAAASQVWCACSELEQKDKRGNITSSSSPTWLLSSSHFSRAWTGHRVTGSQAVSSPACAGNETEYRGPKLSPLVTAPTWSQSRQVICFAQSLTYRGDACPLQMMFACQCALIDLSSLLSCHLERSQFLQWIIKYKSHKIFKSFHWSKEILQSGSTCWSQI